MEIGKPASTAFRSPDRTFSAASVFSAIDAGCRAGARSLMYNEDRALLEKYIQDHVETLLKQPRSFIRYPFIDPGSVYDGNVWDWDTY